MVYKPNRYWDKLYQIYIYIYACICVREGGGGEDTNLKNISRGRVRCFAETKAYKILVIEDREKPLELSPCIIHGHNQWKIHCAKDRHIKEESGWGKSCEDKCSDFYTALLLVSVSMLVTVRMEERKKKINK